MGITRYEESCMEGGGVAPDRYGSFVEYSDYVESHAVDIAVEREKFELANKIPSDCVWCGNGYAATQFGAWSASDYAKKWEGWIQCARSREIK